MQYAVECGFPSRRGEIQLALIGLRIAQMMGAKEATLEDFMLTDKRAKPKKAKGGGTAQEAALGIRAFTGAGFRKLGQGRKKK